MAVRQGRRTLQIWAQRNKCECVAHNYSLFIIHYSLFIQRLRCCRPLILHSSFWFLHSFSIQHFEFSLPKPHRYIVCSTLIERRGTGAGAPALNSTLHSPLSTLWKLLIPHFFKKSKKMLAICKTPCYNTNVYLGNKRYSVTKSR